MKFTSLLLYRHPKYFYYASNYGWGMKKYKETFHRQWKYQIGINKNLKVEDYITDRKFELPPGYVIKDPKDFIESKTMKVNFKQLPKDRPWPFNKLEEKGSSQDPDYREKREFVFNRKSKLFEGLKGALNFTNTILESEDELPDKIMDNEDKLVLDKEILEMLKRRLEWSDKLDSQNIRNNLIWEFPRLNKWTTSKFGPTLDRRELNVLTTYSDCSELLVAKQFGYFYYPKVISPKYEIAFQREDNRCILDLRCDFITLQQNPIHNLIDKELNEYLKGDDYLFSKDVQGTKSEELIDISPINWEINFDKSHFYPLDNQLNKPSRINEQNIDTVFLGNNFNIYKPTPDRIIKGKLLLYLYGYAVGRARQLYGNHLDFQDKTNYKVLDKPITIKGVFINYSKKNLGLACLQLNTLSFDSDIKNQAWFDGPYDVIEDQEEILRLMSLMNLNSYESIKGSN